MTGATGFVGKALVRRLVAAARYEVRAAVRREVTSMGDGIEIVETGDLSSSTDWSRALSGVDVVVALADRVLRLASLPPAERAAMGARGLEYSRREFDRDRLLTQLEGWISGLVAGSRGTGPR